MSATHSPILVVEDDPNDVFFLELAFEEVGIPPPIEVLDDGGKALDYLAGRGRFADRRRFPLPALVLLDLKLPVKMGLDVLRWIREQPDLQPLVVLILTSSSNDEDVQAAYRLGANAFLVKPLSLEKRVAMARAIKAFWLDLNKFPDPETGP